MTEPDPKTQALQYIAQALNDYAASLPLSVRVPFLREAQEAIRKLEPEASKAE